MFSSKSFWTTEIIAKCIAFSNLFRTFGWHWRSPSKFANKFSFLFLGSLSLRFRFQEFSFTENISKVRNILTNAHCRNAHATKSLRAALQFRATRKFKDRVIMTIKVHMVMLEWAVKSSFLTPNTTKRVFFYLMLKYTGTNFQYLLTIANCQLDLSAITSLFRYQKINSSWICLLYSDTVHSVLYSDYQPGLFHSHNSQNRKKYNLLINEDLDGKPKDIVMFSS
jgi:hypothetical protein